jgi:hypothetical protein
VLCAKDIVAPFLEYKPTQKDTVRDPDELLVAV